MPSLKDLPNELVVRTAESLCTHCTSPAGTRLCPDDCLDVSPHCGSRSTNPQEIVKASSAALSALRLVSRRFREIATRILYHRPSTSKRWLLARTLINRPDLALHVKSLVFPEAFTDPADVASIPDEVKEYYRAKISEYANSLDGPDGFINELARRWGGSDSFNVLVEGNDFYHVTLLASLCANVEVVEAVAGSVEGFHFSAPGSLMKPHTLGMCHHDTEGGMYLGDFKSVFEAAPNLRALRCLMVAGDGEVETTKLEEVDLQLSALGAEALVRLLKVCPALEIFSCVAGGARVGYTQFNPGHAKDALLRHAPRLKKVYLGYVDWEGVMGWNDWDLADNEGVVAEFEERGIEAVVMFD
ncbi:hypothetical protein OQA88_8165 [Cercophora sp. LCS_1]